MVFCVQPTGRPRKALINFPGQHGCSSDGVPESLNFPQRFVSFASSQQRAHRSAAQIHRSLQPWPYKAPDQHMRTRQGVQQKLICQDKGNVTKAAMTHSQHPVHRRQLHLKTPQWLARCTQSLGCCQRSCPCRTLVRAMDTTQPGQADTSSNQTIPGSPPHMQGTWWRSPSQTEMTVATQPPSQRYASHRGRGCSGHRPCAVPAGYVCPGREGWHRAEMLSQGLPGGRQHRRCGGDPQMGFLRTCPVRTVTW